MVPRTAHRIADRQALTQGAAVMGAGRAYGPETIGPPHQQNGLAADMSRQKPVQGRLRDRYASAEVRPCSLLGP
ncbi:hypothetical protein D3C73_971480 [compost metagenome]